MTWTEALKTELARLWHEGLSTAAIARQIGQTKGATIGMAHRMALPRRENPVKPRQKLEANRANRAMPKSEPEQESQRPAPAETEPAVLSNSSTCQFIAGDPSPDDSCKCGRPARLGSSYCPEHHARCWDAPHERYRKRQA